MCHMFQNRKKNLKTLKKLVVEQIVLATLQHWLKKQSKITNQRSFLIKRFLVRRQNEEVHEAYRFPGIREGTHKQSNTLTPHNEELYG